MSKYKEGSVEYYSNGKTTTTEWDAELKKGKEEWKELLAGYDKDCNLEMACHSYLCSNYFPIQENNCPRCGAERFGWYLSGTSIEKKRDRDRRAIDTIRDIIHSKEEIMIEKVKQIIIDCDTEQAINEIDEVLKDTNLEVTGMSQHDRELIGEILNKYFSLKNKGKKEE